MRDRETLAALALAVAATLATGEERLIPPDEFHTGDSYWEIIPSEWLGPYNAYLPYLRGRPVEIWVIYPPDNYEWGRPLRQELTTSLLEKAKKGIVPFVINMPRTDAEHPYFLRYKRPFPACIDTLWFTVSLMDVRDFFGPVRQGGYVILLDAEGKVVHHGIEGWQVTRGRGKDADHRPILEAAEEKALGTTVELIVRPEDMPEHLSAAAVLAFYGRTGEAEKFLVGAKGTVRGKERDKVEAAMKRLAEFRLARLAEIEPAFEEKNVYRAVRLAEMFLDVYSKFPADARKARELVRKARRRAELRDEFAAYDAFKKVVALAASKKRAAMKQACLLARQVEARYGETSTGRLVEKILEHWPGDWR